MNRKMNDKKLKVQQTERSFSIQNFKGVHAFVLSVAVWNGRRHHIQVSHGIDLVELVQNTLDELLTLYYDDEWDCLPVSVKEWTMDQGFLTLQLDTPSGEREHVIPLMPFTEGDVFHARHFVPIAHWLQEYSEANGDNFRFQLIAV